MRLLLQIFEVAFIYLYDLFKKIHIKYKFLLIPITRLATQSANHNSLKNLENPVQKRCFHISTLHDIIS